VIQSSDSLESFSFSSSFRSTMSDRHIPHLAASPPSDPEDRIVPGAQSRDEQPSDPFCGDFPPPLTLLLLHPEAAPFQQSQKDPVLLMHLYNNNNYQIGQPLISRAEPQMQASVLTPPSWVSTHLLRLQQRATRRKLRAESCVGTQLL
jgi:hypothetical protein